ncbi:hypothetical protein [Bradyrhizobium sp. ORS 111]|uniref:hypothetical protein n=1 Tax=Bradyrhizobium sp. ORS 111 TaxID=1685958 RepID=UPI00388E3BDA
MFLANRAWCAPVNPRTLRDPRCQDIARQTGVELTVPALTPSRAIDSMVVQFSRKIRVASLALSAWIVRLHARLAPLLASWKWKTNPDDSALRAPDGPCCMKALPQLPCLASHPRAGLNRDAAQS